MTKSHIRVNQIVSYGYSSDEGEVGPWKVISRQETMESLYAPEWAGKEFYYLIKNQASGQVIGMVKEKNLHTKKDKFFSDFL